LRLPKNIESVYQMLTLCALQATQAANRMHYNL
jgi:hypothetical protein